MDGGTPDDCTSCKPGFYLNVITQTVMSGNCIAKDTAPRNFDFLVLGRDQTLSNYQFDSIPAAIYKAYMLSDSFTGATVNIYLRPRVEHFILLSDMASYTVPMRWLISPIVTINIL